MNGQSPAGQLLDAHWGAAKRLPCVVSSASARGTRVLAAANSAVFDACTLLLIMVAPRRIQRAYAVAVLKFLMQIMSSLQGARVREKRTE